MKKVLIVDDDELVRKTLRRILEILPLEVREAEDGEQGLALIQDERLDLVVTDCQMPKLSGLEMLNQCRQDFPNLPCIVISGSHMTDVGKLDGIYFLKKPVDLSNLVALVESILDINQQVRT